MDGTSDASDAHSWHFASGIPSSAGAPSSFLVLRERLRARFEVRAMLGRGGMGAVFLARDVHGARDVALKVVTVPLNARALARFRREGELTAALRHPGIVAVHEAGEVDGVPFLAYELVQGACTLEQAFARGLPRDRVVAVVRDAALAAGHAHAHGVVHRDLKPSNILLDEEGRVRLADFGLAWFEGAEALTQTGAILGTPSYMAPEQLDGARSGAWADVWSLGAVLYEALTGARPFPADTLPSLIAAVALGALIPPRTHDPSISRALETVCLCALEHDPRNRYLDGTALAADLTAALEGRPVRARRLSRGRVRALRLSAGLIVLMIVAAALGASALADARMAAATREVQEGGDPRALADLLDRWPLTTVRKRGLARLALAEASLRDGHPEACVREAGAVADGGDPALRVRAERLRATGLAAVGRHADAAVAAARAHAESGEVADLIAAAEAWRAAGDLIRAEETCRAGLAAPSPRDAVYLLARIQMERGELAEARETLALPCASGLELASELLTAELAEAVGEDPRPRLEAAARTWPDRPEPVLALGSCALALGDIWTAAELLRSATARGVTSGGLDELARAVRLSPSAEPAPTRWSAPPVRRAIARCWLRQAAREVALAERALDPLVSASPGIPSAAVRAARASRLVSAALTLFGRAVPLHELGQAHGLLARLAPAGSATRQQHLDLALRHAPDPPLRRLLARERLASGRAEAALEVLVGDDTIEGCALRGQALVALGEYAEARPHLEAAIRGGREEGTTLRALAAACAGGGDSEDAARWRGRAARFEQPARAEAEALVQDLRRDRRWSKIPPAVALAEYDRAAELDPFDWSARGYAAELRFQAREFLPALRELADLLLRRPQGLDRVQGLFIGRSASGLGELAALARDLPFENTSRDRRARALLLAAAVEYERCTDLGPSALAGLNALVHEDPGDVSALTLRAGLLLRLGRLEQAQRDLELAEEAAPDAASIAFYQALLLALQRAPATAVCSAIQRAQTLGFDVWSRRAWAPDLYPEMRPYRGTPGMDAFFMQEADPASR